MAHRIRISANGCSALGSPCAGDNHTEIGDWNYVENTPDKVGLLPFHAKAKLPSGPAMRAVASYHVLCADEFGATLLAPALSNQVISVIVGQVTTEQAIWYVGSVLGRCRLIVV